MLRRFLNTPQYFMFLLENVMKTLAVCSQNIAYARQKSKNKRNPRKYYPLIYSGFLRKFPNIW